MRITRRIAIFPVATFVALILATLLPDHGFAACQYPDVVKALGAEPNPEGLKIALLPAGVTPEDFLMATRDALSNLRHTDNALIRSLELRSPGDGSSVESKFVEARHENYDAFVVLDSEFMKGGYPKYNEVLDYYRDKNLGPYELMLIDPFPPAIRHTAFVQVTAERGADKAALLLELAAAFIAHPGLTGSGQFMRYASLVTDYAGWAEARRPSAGEVTKSRTEVITECLGTSGP